MIFLTVYCLRFKLMLFTANGRSKLSRRVSEQSRALLAEESSESDSGVDEKQVGKYSEGGPKPTSVDDFVVSLDTDNGAVRYESGSVKKSTSDIASLSRSLSAKSSGMSSTKSIGSRFSTSLPNHYFHTIVFDCTGWTFIDTMGIDLLKQVNLNEYT